MRITAQLNAIEAIDREHLLCKKVIEQIKGRVRDVLLAFAQGLGPQEVANLLGISKKTVDAYKTRLLEICRLLWNPDQNLTYHFLREKFAWLNPTDIAAFEQDYKCCKQVIAQATERQREVLRAFALGLDRLEVADYLGISKKTVDTYKTELYELCRNAWDLPPHQPLRYHFFQERFASYYGRER